MFTHLEIIAPFSIKQFYNKVFEKLFMLWKRDRIFKSTSNLRQFLHFFKFEEHVSVFRSNKCNKYKSIFNFEIKFIEILNTYVWYCACKKLNSSLILSSVSAIVNLICPPWGGGPWNNTNSDVIKAFDEISLRTKMHIEEIVKRWYLIGKGIFWIYESLYNNNTHEFIR